MTQDREHFQDRIISWVQEFHDVPDNMIGFGWQGTNEFYITIKTDDYDETLEEAIKEVEMCTLTPARNFNGYWMIVGKYYENMSQLEQSDMPIPQLDDEADYDEADYLQ